MNLLHYLMSLGIGEVNVEEDHKIKITIVRTKKMLTPEQQEKCKTFIHGMGVQFVVSMR